MTGFGRFSAVVDGVSIDISIKSVNGRYLEVRPHLPRKYTDFENELIKMVKGSFHRGTVDVYVQRTLKTASGSLSAVQFNTPVAQNWIKEFRKVLKQLKLNESLSAQDVLNIPGFISSEEQTVLSSKEKQVLLKTMRQAIENCETEKSREGAFLSKTCLGYLQTLQKNIQSLDQLRQLVAKEAPRKMEERLKKILGDVNLDPHRLLQEVGHILERSDVEEEIQRFNEHLQNVTQIFKSKDAQGKKLDFYAQELLREVNTIGSKSHSAKITELVVTCKNVIEQLREQIQNIE